MIYWQYPKHLRETLIELEESGYYEDWDFLIGLYRSEYWHKFYGERLERNEVPIQFICRRLKEHVIQR